MLRLSILAVLSAAGAGLSACAAEPGVSYTIHLDQVQSQILRVDATVHDPDREVEFVLPVWRPGRYGILDFASTVRQWEAHDGSGHALPVAKSRKNAWVVETDGADEVTLTYEIYANSLGDRTRHADDSHVYIDGSSIFVMDPAHRDEEHTVRFDGRQNWDIATGLEQANRTLSADTYDTLIDSPIEIGTHRRVSFEVRGVPHEIVIWGPCARSDDELIESFSKIIEAEADVFGMMPYDRFVFLIHSYPSGGGGTEHLNSTIMQTDPASFESDSAFRGFLGLVSHEFFHTWNVKHFRPAGITPYDYDRENYTTQLWVAEGCTSYYDDLILARTGQRTLRDYLDAVAGTIGSVRSSPARSKISLAQSSFDAWLKFWGPSSPDNRNTIVNIYSQGHVTTLALDMLIRRNTQGQHSFDDVMRLMNERYTYDTGGYTPEQFLETVSEVAEQDMTDFFDEHVNGVEPMPLEDLLLTVGLELQLKDPEPEPFAGLSLRKRDGVTTVSSLRDDGPAFAVGFNVGDEIVSINGERADPDVVGDLIENAEPDEDFTIGFFRREQYHELQLTPVWRVAQRYTIDFVEDPSADQREQFENWIGQPWPEDDDTK